MTINDHLEAILRLAHHYCTGSSCEHAINPQIASHFRAAMKQARDGEADNGGYLKKQVDELPAPRVGPSAAQE